MLDQVVGEFTRKILSAVTSAKDMYRSLKHIQNECMNLLKMLFAFDFSFIKYTQQALE